MKKLSYLFELKRIKDTTDDDYHKALKIYLKTTPISIKTDSNEITYWLEKEKNNVKFELLVFALFINGDVVGFSMMSYLKDQKIVVYDYIALIDEYRKNTAFFSFINLMKQYVIELNYDIDYYIVEISNKDDGLNIDKESEFFKKLICLEEFGKINSYYQTLPLGLDDHEGNFEAFIYIASNDAISNISKGTYLEIVSAIYYDYYLEWYRPFIYQDTVITEYKELIDNIYENVVKGLHKSENLQVSYSACSLNGNTLKSQNTSGQLPSSFRRRDLGLFPLLLVAIIVIPLFLVWVYNMFLNTMNIQINSVSSILGAVVSSIIVSFITLILSRKKL